MKELLLLRHAKSSWQNAELPDHDRPLNKRGERDAPRMGKLLRKLDMLPSLILCSTATRARETASRVCLGSGYTGPVRHEGELYHKESPDWLALIRQAPDDVARLLVVAHNPGLEMLLAALTRRQEVMPTASLARVQLPVARWQDLDSAGNATLIHIWRPKDL
jgi:phosphohistidine phosphatase